MSVLTEKEVEELLKKIIDSSEERSFKLNIYRVKNDAGETDFPLSSPTYIRLHPLSVLIQNESVSFVTEDNQSNRTYSTLGSESREQFLLRMTHIRDFFNASRNSYKLSDPWPHVKFQLYVRKKN